MPVTPAQITQDRILGAALIGIGFIMVLAMLHHPVINAGTPERAVEEILHEAPVNQLVHGIAIFVMLLQLYGFTVFRDRSTPHSGPRLSTLLFAAGAAAMICAALLSGFVTPTLASYMQGSDLTGFQAATGLVHAGNQSLAGFASIALALSALTSAWPIWAKGGLLRLTSLIGGLTGTITLALVTTNSGIDVIAMTAIAIGLSLWSACMGLYLLMQKA